MKCVLASTAILSLSTQSLTVLLSVLSESEEIRDLLKSMAPDDDAETECHNNRLIDALARMTFTSDRSLPLDPR